jgi:hypothetical protein
MQASRSAGPLSGTRRMIQASALLLAVWAAALAAPRPAVAQGLLDWPVRTELRPEALLSGAAAVFWNPAAAMPAGRAELLAADLDVPTGVRGIAVAGTVAAGARVAIAAGYEHLRIDDVDRTSNSPIPDPGVAGLDLSEHVFSLGGSLAVTRTVSAGTAVRYMRHGEGLGGGNMIGLAAGGAWAPALRHAPRLGGTFFAARGQVDWSLGAEVAPVLDDAGTALVVGYGVQ